MPERKKKQLNPHAIVALNEIAPNVLTLETNRVFDFVPGQVVAVALDPEEEPRLYSIASGNNGNTIRLLFDVNPAGLLTPRLAHLKKGDTILMSEPFGRFLGTDEPAWWIATGTGVAPFISMAESGLHHNKTLLHGARIPGEFWFSDYFLETMGNRYMRFATRETAEGIQEGRLTKWLEAQEKLPTEIKYFLCGNANMIVAVRDILVQKGVPYDNIIAEIYF